MQQELPSVRLNKLIAQRTGLSRRAADTAIADGRVTVNDKPAEQGAQIAPEDIVQLDGEQLPDAKKCQIVHSTCIPLMRNTQVPPHIIHKYIVT